MARLPKVKLRAIPVFPSTVEGGNAITVTKENGTYSIDLDVSDFNVSGVAEADELTTYAISWGQVTDDNPDGSFQLVPYASIQSSSDDITTLVDLGTTGMVARIGDADYATRTITAGTGLGVTDGDGVAGDPTIAITNAELLAVAGVTSAADRLFYFTGSGTGSLATFTSFGRSLVDDADAATAQATLGLVIGTNVQAYDADLAALSANSTDGLWAHTGAGTGAARTLTAPVAGLSITNPAGIAGNPTFALANDLAALEALSGTDTLYYRSGADTWTAVTIGGGLSFSSGTLNTAGGGGAILSGYINGFTISNNGADATNDIDIALGLVADSTSAVYIAGTAMTKRLDANWSAGTGNGMRDSGAAITDTTYHIYAVAKALGADPDYYAHTSATVSTVITALQAESGGASYIYARRIGSIIRSGGTILAFRQYGDYFKLVTPVTNRSSTSAVAAGLLAVTAPAGIKTAPLLRVSHQQNAAGNTTIGLGDGDSTSPMTTVVQTIASMEIATAIIHNFFTNTSSQINFEAAIISGTINGSAIITFGWIDDRGR